MYYTACREIYREKIYKKKKQCRGVTRVDRGNLSPARVATGQFRPPLSHEEIRNPFYLQSRGRLRGDRLLRPAQRFRLHLHKIVVKRLPNPLAVGVPNPQLSTGAKPATRIIPRTQCMVVHPGSLARTWLIHFVTQFWPTFGRNWISSNHGLQEWPTFYSKSGGKMGDPPRSFPPAASPKWK